MDVLHVQSAPGACVQRGVKKIPKKFEARRYSNLLVPVNIDEAFAAALQQQRAGQLAEAEDAYRRILEINSHQPEVYYNLGLVLRMRGQLQDAVFAYEQALELRPRFPEAINNLGVALQSLGQLDEAEDVFRHALLLEPNSADIWNNLGGVLKDLGRLDESIESLQRAVELQPQNAQIHSNLLFTLHYSPKFDAVALRQAAVNWDQRHGTPWLGQVGLIRIFPSRTGDYGSDISRVISANIARRFSRRPSSPQHDHSRFEIFGYCDVTTPDAVTARLQTCTDTSRQTAKMDDAQITALIEHDQIDVLVDLTLHMDGHRLAVFARSPAPVQVTWLGYPGTTGMQAINYRITDPRLDPEGADEFYVEKSLRLPDSFWCYDSLTNQPAVNRLPAERTGQITFGCLNNFCKVTEEVLALWAQVLRSVPNSKLLLLAPSGAARAG